ncbi:MAG: hypothetical protein H0W40_11520 [Methylibium sp.]|uniref:hypothetical protein n=1 Tax=Methylibium sp. TaxID=2067992 RepID=UPI0017AAC01B|nr:hypothetical protein [Methylibium sp.]MBA3597986.1 hypothetical protein [Methylibium sp.]
MADIHVDSQLLALLYCYWRPEENALFATTPRFEDGLSRRFGDPDRAYWRAFELTTFAPWYLLTYQVSTLNGEVFLQTVAIAWETTLRGEIEILGANVIRGLHSVRLLPSGEANWSMRKVRTVLTPTDDEASTMGPVLFVFEDEPLTTYDSHFDVAARVNHDRNVLVSFAGQPE